MANVLDEEASSSEWNALYFLSTIVLQMISFIFLYNFKSSEYIVYIFSFIVFCLTPFLWIRDLLAVGNVLNKNSRYYSLFQYKKVSLVISFLFTFLGLSFILKTNESIRKQKVKVSSTIDKTEYWNRSEQEREKPNELNSLDRTGKNRTVLILYTAIISLLWGVVLETFSNSETFGKKKAFAYDSGFTSWIGWLLDKPYSFIHDTETAWHSFTNNIAMTPLLKTVALYCITFIIMLFGVFLRIQTGNIKVVNVVENVFNRDTALFFACLLLCGISWLGIGFVFAFNKISNPAVIKYSFLSILIGIFGIMFGMLRKTMSEVGIQKLIMFLKSAVISLLGTPVLIGIMQIISEIFGQSLHSLSFPYAILLGSSLFLILLFSVFFRIHTDSFNNLLVNALMICMAVSLFISLTPTYLMFTNLYNLLTIVAEGLLVYIVPVLLIVLSLMMLIYSFNAHQMIKTDG